LENFLTSNSGIPYLRLGAGAGEPLILIHGLGEMKEGWNDQFELSDQYDLIIPDLRGHGDHKNTEGISMRNFADDILSILKELEIESAHICGLSMGGLVAQEIYRCAPKMCRSLILVSTFHFMPKHLGKLLYKLRKNRASSISIEEHKLIAARICLYSRTEENCKKFLNYYRPDKEAYIKSVEACMKVNNFSLLPTINIPTLIIGGQYDSVTPVWVQLLMHKQIVHSEFVIMRNSGHVAKLEAKDSFNRALRGFLDKQKLAAC
jgi:pimeloyl-ACP methyl ester carboxylesterase